MTKKHSIDQAGIDLIKRFEAWEAEPYQDVAGYWTIGYGHLIKEGESFGAISSEQGEALLKKDVSIAVNTVNRLVNTPINQAQFNALVSFVFNVGSGAFADSTLLKKLNAGDLVGAMAEFKRWNKSRGQVVAGLTNRRFQEATIFGGGVLS